MWLLGIREASATQPTVDLASQSTLGSECWSLPTLTVAGSLQLAESGICPVEGWVDRFLRSPCFYP